MTRDKDSKILSDAYADAPGSHDAFGEVLVMLSDIYNNGLPPDTSYIQIKLVDPAVLAKALGETERTP